MTSDDIRVLGKHCLYCWYLSHCVKFSVLKKKGEVNQMGLGFSFTETLKFLFFFTLKEFILDLWKDGQAQRG